MLQKPEDVSPTLVTAPKGKVVINIPEGATQIGMWWSDDGKGFNYAFYGKHERVYEVTVEDPSSAPT